MIWACVAKRLVKKSMVYEVEGARPRGRRSRTIILAYLHAHFLASIAAALYLCTYFID